jgi:hypothetical protein
MPWFTLRTIDPDTHCWLEEAHFEYHDPGEVARLAGIDTIAPGLIWELSPDEYGAIVSRFALSLPAHASESELHSHSGADFNRRFTHTGRELLLMLRGEKPFAAFADVSSDVIPENWFAPHVQSGRIIMRAVEQPFITPLGNPVILRRVLYALPGEEWRMDAYLTLWRLAEKHGWNAGFELLEGYLLGYEQDIDLFFAKRIPATA